MAGSGNVIYTDTGDDHVEISGLLRGDGQAMFADASSLDRIYYNGGVLSGALKNIADESPWAVRGLVKYSVNEVGDLVITSAGNTSQGTLFVSNFNNTLTGPLTANITLGEIAAGAYNPFRAKVDYPYGVTLRDTIDQFPQTIKAVAATANVQYDPIILDLDGDGVETTTVSSIAPYFDFNGDGFAERTGWVHSDDGFLAIDANEDGKITADELFGSATVAGYTALAAIDSNSDDVIDVNDAAFADLVVWQDLNQNGVTDTGELKTLAELGIKSIDVVPTSTTATTQAGNTIAAEGTFTWDDDSTGTTGEVLFNATPYYAEWLEDVTISVEAEALPNLVGHGTIPQLHLAMSYAPALVDTVEDTLLTLNTNDLETLRDNIIPLLEEWMDAIPVPSGAPGTTPRDDVPVLATADSLSGPEVNDYGMKVTDGMGTYWVLASGDDVLDEFDEVIERPTYADVLAQDGWSALSGTTIQFFERWVGLNIPLGVEGGQTGQTATDSAKAIFSSFWAELNTLAVRLAVQGPLESIFEDIAYNVESDTFSATTDAQLVPLFENLMTASANLTAFEAWMPVVNVFLNDFERPNGLDISYSWLYQNIVAAYENVTPAGFTLSEAAIGLGVPSDKLVSSGTAESDIFYMTSGNQTVDGGEGADAYVFGQNFGQDVIEDADSGGGYDHA
ncbi:MAG TPA: hypothetical protein VHP34_01145, partial [Alphaproteobacteria bacterium]|nr:hypothetical protein [Alphaproteobacteria bacterium]